MTNKPTTRNKTVTSYAVMRTSFQVGELDEYITTQDALWFHISLLIKHRFARFVPYKRLTQPLQSHNKRSVTRAIISVYAWFFVFKLPHKSYLQQTRASPLQLQSATHQQNAGQETLLSCAQSEYMAGLFRRLSVSPSVSPFHPLSNPLTLTNRHNFFEHLFICAKLERLQPAPLGNLIFNCRQLTNIR